MQSISRHRYCSNKRSAVSMSMTIHEDITISDTQEEVYENVSPAMKKLRSQEQFYEFLDPATSMKAKVTAENAMVLAPWFNEYRMDNRLKECDVIISSNEYILSFLDVPVNCIVGFEKETIDSFWMTYHVNGSVQVPQRSIQTVTKMLEYYSICEQCCLNESFDRALKGVNRMMCSCYDLLVGKHDIVKTLVDIYNSHKDKISSLLDKDASELFAEIAEVEDMDWTNDAFKKWIDSKLAILVMNQG